MNNRQNGFGAFQMLMVIAVIGVLSVTAVPKYQSFVDKAKLTEAFNLASESKRKISEFYMTNNRLPRNIKETQGLKSETVTAPEFVRDMEVVALSGNHAVMVKVYLQNDVVENTTGVDQYIYMAVDQSKASRSQLEWSCGAQGVDTALLPEGCQS